MKKTALALIMVLLITLLLVASFPSLRAVSEAPQIEWQKTYTPLSGYSLAQTSDGGYIIAGQQAAWKIVHDTSYWTNMTALLIKVDASGDVEWTKTYGNEVGGGGCAYSVVRTMGSGYAIIGLQQTPAREVVFLIKTDAEGNIQWNTTIAWLGDTMLCEGTQTSDGGYLIAGSSRYGESGSGMAWILKTDENGNTLWNRTFGNFGSTQVWSVRALAVAEADDGGCLVAGNWMNDCWFAKTDVSGNLQWNQTYDFRFNDEVWYTYAATSIAKTADGGYILGGGNNKRGFLVKTNSEGVMQWNRPYEDNSGFTSVAQTTNRDGYFAVGGFSDPSDYDVWFVRLDSSGDLLWDSTYDIPRGDYRHQNAARSVVKTSDGGYAVVGALNGTIWLVKFAPESNAPPENTPFPTTLLIAVAIIVVIVAGVGLGLLIYLIKRK